MKILLLCWIIMLLSTFVSLANSKNIINISKNFDLLTDSYNLCGIFYEDGKNNIVIVDLEVVEDDLATLSVLKDGETVFRHDLKEINMEPVYELELDQFATGYYTIQLTTDSDISVERQIMVQ